tara:strand:+ start:763 stop:1560 length:798 start_codon:yes stop_codon:yes gene_type:complete
MKYPHIIKNTAYGRVYQVKKGLYFPSVTTVLNYSLPKQEYLIKWIIENSEGSYERHLNHSGEASEVGTAIHNLIERIVAGEIIELGDDPLEYVSGKGYYPTYKTLLQIQKGLQSFLNFWNNNKPEVEYVEKLMYTTDKHNGNYILPFAGRCDACVMIDGERWLIDYKSSKVVKDVLSYQIQLSMYTAIHNHNNPDKKIDRMGIVHCNKSFKGVNPPKSTMNPIEYKYRPDLIKSVYTIFQEVYDGFELGKPKTKEPAPKVFNIEP